jgi:hypothetical protein
VLVEEMLIPDEALKLFGDVLSGCEKMIPEIVVFGRRLIVIHVSIYDG